MCPGCGTVLRIQGKTYRELCNKCAAEPANWPHGELNTYKRRGCRCSPCREVARVAQSGVRERAATRHHYVCEFPECSVKFTSYDSSRKFCSVLCGIRSAQSRYVSSFRALVPYDSVFAGVQQERLDNGKHENDLHDPSWIDPVRRHALYELHGWTCQECGALCSRKHVDDGLPTITLDHLLPRTRWPENHPLMHDDFNLTVLCQSCNSHKFNHFTPRAWPSILVLSGDLSVEDVRALRRSQIKTFSREEVIHG